MGARRAELNWLLDHSEMGQNTVGNMVPQNVADWAICHMLEFLLTLESNGAYPLQRWHQLVQAKQSPWDDGAAGKNLQGGPPATAPSLAYHIICRAEIFR
jgi:hypothetical protein